MRTWMKEIERTCHMEYYLRFDYIMEGNQEEIMEKMQEFKDDFLGYFLAKNISEDLLIEKSQGICMTNVVSDYQSTVGEIIDNIFDRKNKENNIKGLIGESICAWLCESFDPKPILFLPDKRGNASEQGTDRWELRYDDGGKILLRIWSAKCTENNPSSRASEIRKNDFSNIEIMGILDQVTDQVKYGQFSSITLDDIKQIRLSALREWSQLSFGVVMIIDWELYQELYERNEGRKLNFFTQPFAEYAERIVRFVPIENLKDYVLSFEPNVYAKLRGE